MLEDDLSCLLNKISMLAVITRLPAYNTSPVNKVIESKY